MVEVSDHSSRSVALRAVEAGDVPVLFEYQLDPEGNDLAGTKPRNAETFHAIWEKILQDSTVVARVIVHEGVIVGVISCFDMDGVDAVGYWIGRDHWGKGFATQGLSLFLRELERRPLHATAARANSASIRVLERCGFRLTGYHMGEETDRYVAREVATFVLE